MGSTSIPLSEACEANISRAFLSSKNPASTASTSAVVSLISVSANRATSFALRSGTMTWKLRSRSTIFPVSSIFTVLRRPTLIAWSIWNCRISVMTSRQKACLRFIFRRIGPAISDAVALLTSPPALNQ